MAIVKKIIKQKPYSPHPNEPKLDELFPFLSEALKSGDERKVYAINSQIKRMKNE